MNLLFGIWLLDCINLIKYNGVDVFDSILNISSSQWWSIAIPFVLVYIILIILKIWTDK
ncbi:hypothetical protein [Romboutsia sp.]|uniref:hypothetical protein n=1 Tax=Romboutsia sp. TaxID=1965302 RepID=UPI002BD5AB4C|nr:hypothetical protein [Romboutsia sp.]HSQ89562.1 hypothetical protein [Romboutsia sp.]